MTENFRRISLECAPRTELHDALGLTGCEVSVNALPAGAAVPFVHRHVKNEEVYGVLEGRGELYIDGEVVELKAGDWFRISPRRPPRHPRRRRSGHPLRLHPDEGGEPRRIHQRRRRRLRRKGALALSPLKFTFAAVRVRILSWLRVRTAFFVFLPSSFCRLPFAPAPSAISRGRLFLAYP